MWSFSIHLGSNVYIGGGGNNYPNNNPNKFPFNQNLGGKNEIYSPKFKISN